MNIVESITKKHTSGSDKKKYWDGSVFEKLISMSPDARGFWGEELVYTLFSQLFPHLYCFWDRNKNTNNEDGSIWDVLINVFKTEVKTAFIGSNGKTFQHENIYQDKEWDKIIFVDVVHSGIWFTIQNKTEIPFGDMSHHILGVKSTPHLSGHKFDLSIHRCKKLVDSGESFYFDLTDYDGLKKFLSQHFSK